MLEYIVESSPQQRSSCSCSISLPETYTPCRFPQISRSHGSSRPRSHAQDPRTPTRPLCSDLPGIESRCPWSCASVSLWRQTMMVGLSCVSSRRSSSSPSLRAAPHHHHHLLLEESSPLSLPWESSQDLRMRMISELSFSLSREEGQHSEEAEVAFSGLNFGLVQMNGSVLPEILKRKE